MEAPLPMNTSAKDRQLENVQHRIASCLSDFMQVNEEIKHSLIRLMGHEPSSVPYDAEKLHESSVIEMLNEQISMLQRYISELRESSERLNRL
tara:strand:- start:4779 stop:5057 length:279 start_codon:yes stop_codon:yes gene_type:complete